MGLSKPIRGSNRIKESEKRRIIDDSTRKRRMRKVMALLERDNSHDDPHADLVMSKKIPRFEDSLESRTRGTKKKEKSPDYYAMKFRKSLEQLIEEDRKEAEEKDRQPYNVFVVAQSKHPPCHSCAVCGFKSNYMCVSCGMRICTVRCFDAHYETRCMKWLV